VASRAHSFELVRVYQDAGEWVIYGRVHHWHDACYPAAHVDLALLDLHQQIVVRHSLPLVHRGTHRRGWYGAAFRTRIPGHLQPSDTIRVAFHDDACLPSVLVLSFVAFGAYAQRTVNQSERAASTAEAAMRWLQTTLSSVGDAVITTDARGRVTFVNPEGARVTGWSEVGVAPLVPLAPAFPTAPAAPGPSGDGLPAAFPVPAEEPHRTPSEPRFRQCLRRLPGTQDPGSRRRLGRRSRRQPPGWRRRGIHRSATGVSTRSRTPRQPSMEPRGTRQSARCGGWERAARAGARASATLWFCLPHLVSPLP